MERHTCLLLTPYKGKSKPGLVTKAYVTWCIQHYGLHIVLETGNWSHKRKGTLCQQIKWTFIYTNAGHKQVILSQNGPGTSEFFQTMGREPNWVTSTFPLGHGPLCFPHQKEENRERSGIKNKKVLTKYFAIVVLKRH